MQLDHCVTSAWLWSPDEYRCYGWLRHRLFVLILFVFLFLGCSRLWLLLLFSTFFTLAARCFGLHNRLFNLRLRLQMCKLLRITIEIEQLRDSIRLTQR